MSGMSQEKAYQVAYGFPKVNSTCRTGASRMMTKDNIKTEIARLRAIKDSEAIASRDELAKYYTEAIRAAPSDLDPSSPLVQRASVDAMGNMIIYPVDKIAAAEKLTKLMGYNVAEKIDKEGISEIASILSNIKPQPLVLHNN